MGRADAVGENGYGMGYREGGAWIPRLQERVVKQLGEAPVLGQGTCRVRVPGGPAEAAAAAQTLGQSCWPASGWGGPPLPEG